MPNQGLVIRQLNSSDTNVSRIKFEFVKVRTKTIVYMLCNHLLL